MMTRKVFRGLWLVMVLLVMARANLVWSQSQTKEFSINLKARALVIGPKILLHEICIINTDNKAIRTKLGAVQLGQAPPPGESKELTLAFIKLQIRRAGLQEYLDKVAGPKVIRVTTAHEEISKAVLEDAVTEYVRQHAPEPGSDFRIELHRLPGMICVPQTEYRLEVEPSGTFAGRGYQAFRIKLMAQEQKIATLPVSATIHVFQEVAVAKARLARHQEIDAQAIAFEYREVTHLSGTPVSRKTPLDGWRCKVIIASGKIIEADMLEQSPLVERGKMVRLIVVAGNVEVATQGRAQESGKLAEAVRVRHLHNGKILRGEVTGADIVRVVL